MIKPSDSDNDRFEFNPNQKSDYENKKREIRLKREAKENEKAVKKKVRLEKKLRRIERKKKIKKRIANSIVFIKTNSIRFAAKVMDPTFLLTTAAFIYYVRTSNQTTTEIENQQSQIIRIERVLEQNQNDFGFKKIIGDKHVRRILMNTAVVLVPVGKFVYNNWQTKRQLGHMESQLSETRNELTETKGTLSSTKNQLTETMEEKNRVEGALETAHEAHEVRVNKLHVTLNRFNIAALKSAERETEMRNTIIEDKKLIAETILARDAAEEKIQVFEDEILQKEKQLQEVSLEKAIVQQRYDQKENAEAELTLQLQNERQVKSYWKSNVKKLEKQIRQINSERNQLGDQIYTTNKQIRRLETEKKSTENAFRRENQEKLKANKQVQKLKNQAEKDEQLLQSAIKKTNRYALEMDKANDKISEYTGIEGKKNRQIEELQSKLLEKNTQNDALEKMTQKHERDLDSNVIIIDELNSKIKKTENALKALADSSPKEKAKLEQEVKQKEKIIKNINKNSQRLRKVYLSGLKDLYDNQISQDGLSDEIGKLQKDLKDQENGFYSNLQAERADQTKKYDRFFESSSDIINQILEQQEIDQKKSWWQKISFDFSPSVSIEPKKHSEEKEKKHIERQSYFYTSWEPGLKDNMQVREIWDEETKEWIVISKESELESQKKLNEKSQT